MKRLTLLLTIITTTTACNGEDPTYYCKGYEPEVASTEAYIVNGEEITEETNLSTLALFNEDTGHFACSAVAYRDQIVLTAGHCVVSDNLSVSRSLKGERTKVDDIYLHRAYSGYPHGDIAMLHLAEPIEGPFPAGIYDMAAGGYEPDLRYFCTGMVAQGFGNTRETNPSGLYTIPYEWWGASDLFIMETGPVNPDQGLCNGDSGGGLYAYTQDHPWWQEPTFHIAGIAIGAYDGENCTGQTRHNDLESYSMWIYEVVYCMNGGEDRLWPFYDLHGKGYRGTTCEELRKPL